jgi:hypothetical protein
LTGAISSSPGRTMPTNDTVVGMNIHQPNDQTKYE